MTLKATLVLAGTFLILIAGAASADDTSDLIALDKAWGAAGIKGDTKAAAALLSDTLVSVSPDGITDKKGELAASEPAPAGTTYDAGDYKVTFIDRNTAIMAHSVKGDEAHYSLHVWVRKGSSWQVAATSTTPVAMQ
jgi:Domain of unknown function (DUF4440)